MKWKERGQDRNGEGEEVLGNGEKKDEETVWGLRWNRRGFKLLGEGGGSVTME